jgi:mono/diheme cytochrome c family protein
LLRKGTRPNGTAVAPVMPTGFYEMLTEKDLDAIVAYLRTVKPVRNQVPDPVYKAPVHRDPYPDAEAGFNKTMFTDPVRRGAYLVTIGHCMECHAERTRGVSDYQNGLGHGGRVFPPLPGAPDGAPDSVAANITSHSSAGIGAWSDGEIGQAIVRGISRDGHPLKPPMAFAFYAGLKAADLADIIAYLRTLPPLQ